MASAQCPKPTTTIEVCQPKREHGSFGQKISEMTGKAFKGYHDARDGSSQNQLQCYSQQTLVESHDQIYGQNQTIQDKHGQTKTQIKVTMVEAEITQTYEDHDSYPYGTTTCFGSHAVKNGESNKDRNLFQRLKNHIPHHNNDGISSSRSNSDDDKCSKSKAGVEKCPKSKPSVEKCAKSKPSDEKCAKSKVSDEKCAKSKVSDEKCPKSKAGDEKCPKIKAGDEKCPKSKPSDEKCPKSKPNGEKCRKSKPSEEKCPKSNRCV
ncbi:unnamed protein product [Lupinus luteus]|uniref:Uncharacterized protein n=1 Tax=Lupinus luteus TaxID=3873 RepID=A0AAV1WX66_LUPLU